MATRPEMIDMISNAIAVLLGPYSPEIRDTVLTHLLAKSIASGNESEQERRLSHHVETARGLIEKYDQEKKRYLATQRRFQA